MASEQAHAYGGQAVIEGVMIRGANYYAVAVRRQNGTVATKSERLGSILTGNLRKIPLVRGVLVLGETMVIGMKALSFSAAASGEEEDAEGNEVEELGKGAMALMIGFSLLFAIGLFFLIPVFASKALEGPLGSAVAANIAEGVIRLLIFFAYIYFISRKKEIQRVFMYHGAEHMTVHAQENGDPLDAVSIRKYSTAHPRCGTAFLLTVMIVSVVVFSVVPREPLWWLLLSRVVLVPLVAAFSYEVIRFTGKHPHNPLMSVITKPNLALQKLTTRQPDDDQIEIAVAAMELAIAVDRGQVLPGINESNASASSEELA